MCCVLETIEKILRVVAVIVLFLGLACIGVGVWAILGGDGPLAVYLSDQTWMGIQIIGGLLIGAGAVLAVDFILACCNSTKLLSSCCLPVFFVFALVTTLLFVAVGVCSLTIMGDMLRTSLELSFKYEAEHGVNIETGGPLYSAQQNFKCCGPYPCTDGNTTAYNSYHCTGSCIDLNEGCVDAVMDSLLYIFEYPLAIGCFLVSAITCMMFVLSICLCCL